MLRKGWFWGVVFFVVGMVTASCWAGSYLLSAHGNSTYGVKRVSRLDLGRGNCGHCHDQHASINGVSNGGPYRFVLFSNNFDNTSIVPYTADDSICFMCHGGTTQSGGIINKDYSQTYGLYNAGPTTILGAFNQVATAPSYHNLHDIWVFASGNFTFFTDYSNPCVACHNPHRAKRVQGIPSNPAANTAISLPTAHESLWGDASNETMAYLASYYALSYQAPYIFGSTSSYEPANALSSNGSTLPDYPSFCTTCHNDSNLIYSSELGANLRQINWYGTGGDAAAGPPYPDKHGVNTATVSTVMNAPFNSTAYSAGDLITSCTDCHEPHASPNPYLIRKEVNGVIVTINGTTGNEIGYLCRACHKDDAAANAGTLDVNGWYYIHHSDSDAPYPGPPTGCSWCHGGGGTPPIPCLNCHKHGSNDNWVSTTGKTPTYRICF